MINKEKPFPQANDFEKVKKVLNADEIKLKDYGAMSILLGDITERQVDYYISACEYLGLIDNKTFTESAVRIRNLIGIYQDVELSKIIVSDEVFGTVYFMQKMVGSELELEEVVDIMKDNVSLSSEAMYLRRASTVLSWIKWINSKEIN